MSEQIEKAAQSLMDMCEEMNAFARASVDANLKSVNAAARGWMKPRAARIICCRKISRA